jgi:phage gpG-like protein
MSNKPVEMPDFEALTKGLFEIIAKRAAGQGISHFKGSFFKQGFTDRGFMPWPNRADNLGHKILRQSNNLMDSIKATTVTADRVEITAGEGLPYAAIQNNGGTITVRVTPKMRKFGWYMFKKTGKQHWKGLALTKKERLTIKIPQRQFIGNSEVLNKNIDKAIMEAMQNNLQNLTF